MSASKDETNTTRTSGKPADSGVKGPPQFIQYRLSDEELAQAHNAAENFADVVEIFDQMIGEGYKLSASYDAYGGGTQVFMTPSNKGNVNAGYTLTARAPSLTAAVAVLCWKHYTLFAQDWPKEPDSRKGTGWG